MKENLLVIFAREPVPGRVKTRLANDVGIEASAALYALMLRHTIKEVVSRNYDIVIYKTPESSEIFFNQILPSAVVSNQTEGDLGERMSGAFRSEFARGYRRICIIGTDCPDLSSSDIVQAFDLLGHFELVLGPSRDGGYYLIGLSGFHHDLFVGIAWSTDRVLLGTIGIARSLGIDYHCLAFRADIDDFADLKKYMSKNPETEPALSFAKVLQGGG
jgi:rSAM/selenodomain-associated transferase 1